MRKITYILLLLFPISFAMAQESEPEFVKILKERFKVPYIAERARIDAKILLKVNKTANCDSVAIAYINAELYIRTTKTMFNDTLWRKSLPLGNYFIHLNFIASEPWSRADIAISSDHSSIDSITQNTKTYFVQIFSSGVYAQRALKITHDSLLALYIKTPETIWNAEKKPCNDSDFNSLEIDSNDELIELKTNINYDFWGYSSQRVDHAISYQIILKKDSSIILRKISTFRYCNYHVSTITLSKNNIRDKNRYSKSLELLELLKSFPKFADNECIYDGGTYYIKAYAQGFSREYSYYAPDRNVEIKLYLLFSNLKADFFSLFEF